MFVVILSIIKIVCLLGVLIGIHEGGHFIIAKLCKIRVNEFAIGFGPTIWRKQGIETKYAIRLIPLGGFVRMEGEEEHSEKEGSFSKASIPRRVAVVLAGGLVNIIFGLVIFFVLNCFTGSHVTTTVNDFVPEYAAQNSQIEVGDKILKINNTKVRNSSDVRKMISKSNGEEIKILVQRNNTNTEITIKPTEIKSASAGIYLKGNTSKILTLDKNSAASKADLKANDIIAEINGENVENNPERIINIIKESLEKNLIIKVNRSGDILQTVMTPDTVSTYLLGVYFEEANENLGSKMYYSFWNTKDFSFSIIDSLKQLVSGGVSLDQMMGPVGISQVVAQTSGFADFVYILALVSLSLGVTNLLPIIPLDGGKIVLILIEAVRKKPFKQETEIKLQTIGFMLLMGLSVIILYNDVLRIF